MTTCGKDVTYVPIRKLHLPSKLHFKIRNVSLKLRNCSIITHPNLFGNLRVKDKNRNCMSEGKQNEIVKNNSVSRMAEESKEI